MSILSYAQRRYALTWIIESWRAPFSLFQRTRGWGERRRPTGARATYLKQMRKRLEERHSRSGVQPAGTTALHLSHEKSAGARLAGGWHLPAELVVQPELNHPDIWTFLDADLDPPHLVLLGEPGSGKTTLLHQIADFLVDEKNSDHPRARLPVLLNLSEYGLLMNYERHNLSLVDEITKMLRGTTLEAAWVKEQLKDGHFMILLDGLDDIPQESAHRRLVDWLQSEMLVYGANRFVITSRPTMYKKQPLTGVTVLNIRTLNRQKIGAVIEQSGVREGAARLAQIESRPALTTLAGTPLWLAMLLRLPAEKTPLPADPFALYQTFFATLLAPKNARPAANAAHLSAVAKQNVLQELAYAMMDRGLRQIQRPDAAAIIQPALEHFAETTRVDGQAFLEMVLAQTGLLSEGERGKIQFAHKTFQEYLAAVHIASDEDLQTALLEKIEETWWHETLRAVAGLTDPMPIVRACAAELFSTAPRLLLALDCLEARRWLEPDLITPEMIALLQERFRQDTDQWELAAEGLLRLRLWQLQEMPDGGTFDPSLITNAEYRLFLKRTDRPAPPHWSQEGFHITHRDYPALGMTSVDAAAFCDWMTAWDVDDRRRYRLLAAEEAAHAPAPVSPYADAPVYWVQGSLLAGGRGWQVREDLLRASIAGDLTAAYDRLFVPLLQGLNPFVASDALDRIKSQEGLLHQTPASEPARAIGLVTDMLAMLDQLWRSLAREDAPPAQVMLTAITSDLLAATHAVHNQAVTAIDSAIARRQVLAQIIALALPLMPARVTVPQTALDSTPVRTLDLPLADDLHPARKRDLALALARDFLRDMAPRMDAHQHRALTRDLGRALALDHAPENQLARLEFIAEARLPLVSPVSLDQSLLAFLLDLAYLYDRFAPPKAGAKATTGALDSLTNRWQRRVALLVVAGRLSRLRAAGDLLEQSNFSAENLTALDQVVGAYCQAYCTEIAIEERQNGNPDFAPSEAIRLARDRVG